MTLLSNLCILLLSFKLYDNIANNLMKDSFETQLPSFFAPSFRIKRVLRVKHLSDKLRPERFFLFKIVYN